MEKIFIPKKVKNEKKKWRKIGNVFYKKTMKEEVTESNAKHTSENIIK